MIKASYTKYLLQFKQASGTSRGILRTKETWFLQIEDTNGIGIGECGLFRGLSIDDKPNYEEKLRWVCENINQELSFLLKELLEYPSIQFGLEQAFLSLQSKNRFQLFPSDFSNGKEVIPINGLIWMGDKSFMKKQIMDKLEQGFTTIKMKIGAIDFETELALLQAIRKEFSAKDIVLRVDANGAFTSTEAMEKLYKLAALELHSIEQPIRQGQWQEMALLCEQSPLPIALDEELIGVFSADHKVKCIDTIRPQFIILKPSLVGGFTGSSEWISIAEKYHVGNWITSALESNVGLNAIAQWTYTMNNPLPQGLGTGSLFTNNFKSPLEVTDGNLQYNFNSSWNFNL